LSVLARRRALVVVMDACGVGALPDAASYGDEGANTLAHVAEAVGGLDVPALASLGLGAIVPLLGVASASDPAIHGRLAPLGPGKDSATGHWELMGAVLAQPLPTYPEGFPPEAIARLAAVSGHQLICNRPYNGIAAIEDFGAEHLRTGALIVYTSQDSVLQLAAHVERVAPAQLYAACAAVRAAMQGEHAVGRVIARPFSGREGAFARTEGRRDFALAPPGRTYLQELADAGVPVHGVGKIHDLFAGVGVAHAHAGASNAQALASVAMLLNELERGLAFVNLVETDQLYGHRKDSQGFAAALHELDEGTDHTREYAPLLAVTGEMARRRAAGGRYDGVRHDGALADVGATALRWLTGRDAPRLPGQSCIS
jgi:phosphopentomutase